LELSSVINPIPKINKVRKDLPEEEYFRHENAVPALISKEIWEQAQFLLREKVERNVRAGTGKSAYAKVACEQWFEDKIRERMICAFREMHELYNRQYTPKVKTGKYCRACSLADVCLPKLCKDRSVCGYIQSRMEEEPRGSC
jgi:hypothetical protein